MRPRIGEEFDVSAYPEMQLAFEGPIADEEITIDKWGVWLSAYAPVYDEAGTAVAIVGIDRDVATVLAIESALKSVIIMVFLGALSLSLMVSVLFAKHFTKPINQLKLGAARVISGDLSHRIESTRKDEFGELAAAFNHMTAEVEKLLRHKDEFITQLGHDLKTPLTPLVALLPKIEREEKDPKLKELLGATIHNVNYMKELVIKTLQLARLTSPDTELITEDITLSHEVNNVIESGRSIFYEKDTKVENKISEEIVVKVDKLRFLELFSNLISNAVKFTPDGGSTITIDAKDDKGFVTVSIKDTGIGMTTEELEHAFDEFYKADKSRHELESSGLGLSICKHIVEKHGGKIWAESPGKGMGSTFYFTLKSGGG
jgi:signal transduction histidine kinase